MTLPSDEILERFSRMRVLVHGDLVAPHKPLLCLIALRRLEEGAARLEPYASYRDELAPLLGRFGLRQFRAASPARTANPFWRLQRDGVFEVVPGTGGPDALVPDRSGGVGDARLRAAEARGGFATGIHHALAASSMLRAAVIGRLLALAFPDGVHDEVLEAVGLAGSLVARRPRDPAFRHRVVAAYEHRCAVCAFEVRLEDRAIAIEAAHIRWHQAAGPDEVSNGLCLCPTHHVCFDRGAWTLDDDRRVVVSDRCRDEHSVLLRFHGRPIRPPVQPRDRPAPDHAAWHRAEVFRGDARPVA